MGENRGDKLKQATENILHTLEQIGHKLGYKCRRQWPIKGAIIDLVWYLPIMSSASKIFGCKELLIAGFEIESGDRTVKHIKGDIINLLALHSFIGVILFLKSGYPPKKRNKFAMNIKAAKLWAGKFNFISEIKVWSEKDVENISKEII